MSSNSMVSEKRMFALALSASCWKEVCGLVVKPVTGSWYVGITHVRAVGHEAIVERHAGARDLRIAPEVERHRQLAGHRVATDVHQRVGTRLGLVVDVLAREGQVELVVRREAQRRACTGDVLAALGADLATGTAVARAGRDGEGIVGRAAGRDHIGRGIDIGSVGRQAVAVTRQ
jgi:hypothetical protein